MAWLISKPKAYYGAPSTVDDIMRREAARVVRDGLLALRHDPYMMHQGNMHVEAASGCAPAGWPSGADAGRGAGGA